MIYLNKRQDFFTWQKGKLNSFMIHEWSVWDDAYWNQTLFVYVFQILYVFDQIQIGWNFHQESSKELHYWVINFSSKQLNDGSRYLYFFAIITKLVELVVVFQTLHYGTFQIQRIWSISVSSNFRYIIWSKENRRLASSREAIINYCLPNTECCRYSCLINIKRV